MGEQLAAPLELVRVDLATCKAAAQDLERRVAVRALPDERRAASERGDHEPNGVARAFDCAAVSLKPPELPDTPDAPG